MKNYVIRSQCGEWYYTGHRRNNDSSMHHKAVDLTEIFHKDHGAVFYEHYHAAVSHLKRMESDGIPNYEVVPVSDVLEEVLNKIINNTETLIIL